MIPADELLAEHMLTRAATRYNTGEIHGGTAAIIVAEYSAPALGDIEAWLVFEQLAAALQEHDATQASVLLRTLIRGRRPCTIPDAELLAVATAAGVHQPLTLVTSES
ncbi:hypothetical protein [Microbispora sp. NPDC049633]|uniref:hypothetical protein n=1 Tax=Microbispora sp. NPDC049633 TaxID=3154355 RepID=UPI00342968F8